MRFIQDKYAIHVVIENTEEEKAFVDICIKAMGVYLEQSTANKTEQKALAMIRKVKDFF